MYVKEEIDVCLFVLMLNVPFNSYGQVGTVETDVNCVLRSATCLHQTSSDEHLESGMNASFHSKYLITGYQHVRQIVF